MQVDEKSPLVRALKTAFYERAYRYAEELERQVQAGAITSAQADRKLVAIMSQPQEIQVVIEASAQYQVPH